MRARDCDLPMAVMGGWRRATHTRLAKVEGLVRVLMKPRNGEKWTDEDRAFLWRELRESGSTRLFYLFRIPGSSLLVPVLAWALDRRQADRPFGPGGDRRHDYIGGAIG